MAILSGLHAKTGDFLQLDAGVLVADLTPEEITQIVSGNLTAITTKTLGATKGGTTFSAIPEMRNLLDGVNGSRGNYKDGAIIDSWEISLKTTVSEMTLANISYALAGVKQTLNTPAGVDKQTGTVGRVESSKYIKNVAWVGSLKGNTKPLVILIKNALNTNGMTFTAADKDTGSIELELKAHFELSKPEEVPFEIYTPKGGDS